ncbi:MAG: hypothetical protein ACLPHP_08410 [Candidatus Sulfotelmatobacter sp.]
MKDTKYHEGNANRQEKETEGGALVCGLVVAGRAAGLAVQQAVGAQADVKYRLAQAAVLLALAVRFRLVALGAAILGRTGSGAHEVNVAQESAGENVTEVMSSRDGNCGLLIFDR